MKSDLFSLDGRVALVTGASRGLGREMAKGLAEAGATVVLNGRDATALEARRAELSGLGLKADIAAFDVTDEAAMRTAVAGVAARHGRLDVLVANAGIQHRAKLQDWTSADWRRVVDTNLSACFLMAQAAAAVMERQPGGGRIIFTSSLTARLARPTIHAYVAAKAGLSGLARSLAAELGPKGITCNAIAPGFFGTEMNRALVEDAKFSAWVEGRVPLGRWGDPREIAGVAVFLASAAGAYVNGEEIAVDGGFSAVM